MRTRTTVAGIAAALTVAAAAPAQAADEVVATVTKPTTISAARGHAVWSAWDPAANGYRLMHYLRNGDVMRIRIPANSVPFDIDIGKDPLGGTMGVYSRCERPPASTFALDGRRGCDIYRTRLTSGGGEAKQRNASGPADEYWPAIWDGRIAFTRTYKKRGDRNRRYVYWRHFDGTGPSHRLRRGPDGGVPEQLDMRGKKVTYVCQFEFGAQVRSADTGGGGRALVRVPGSGAAARDLLAQGPTLGGGFVHWAVASTDPIVSEIRRTPLGGGDDERATTQITAAAGLATGGFSFDGGIAWYVKTVDADTFEIHRVTGLRYEPAPPLEID
jgi:hypothetical protein